MWAAFQMHCYLVTDDYCKYGSKESRVEQRKQVKENKAHYSVHLFTVESMRFPGLQRATQIYSHIVASI